MCLSPHVEWLSLPQLASSVCDSYDACIYINNECVQYTWTLHKEKVQEQ